MGLPLKLKGRLYSAFVHSVLLYNKEVWTITETDESSSGKEWVPDEEAGWGSIEECG